MVGLSDAVLLDVLDRVDNGQTFEEIAARLGKTRSSIAGVVFRITRDLKLAVAAPLPRGAVAAYWPENLDGGMPARWWEAGLRKRLPGRLAPSNRRARG